MIGWSFEKRCETGMIGGIGECLFCDAEAGVACYLVKEHACPGHVAHKLDAKYCGRCGIHIDSLRPD